MSDFAAYVFYVNRPDLLKRACDSFPDTWEDLTIIDNSTGASLLAMDDEQMEIAGIPHGARMVGALVPMTYSQSMNWMLADAVRRGKDFILHFHSDAMSTNPNAVQELLSYARRMKAEGRRWACLWTFYDIFWCINPEAWLDIGGCDTTFRDYYIDQDNRRRWNLAGWETIDTCIQGMTHEGSATIRSDKKLEFLNGKTFPYFTALYREKWGGGPGNETFLWPYNNAKHGLKP